jgi:hypothetical protein
MEIVRVRVKELRPGDFVIDFYGNFVVLSIEKSLHYYSGETSKVKIFRVAQNSTFCGVSDVAWDSLFVFNRVIRQTRVQNASNH